MIFGTQISSRSRGGLDLIQKKVIFSGLFIPESSFGFHNFSCFSWFFFGYHFEKWLFTSFDQIVRTETEYENTKEHLPRFKKSKTMISDDLPMCQMQKIRFTGWKKMNFRVGPDLRNEKNSKKTKKELFHFLSLCFRSESSFRFQVETDNSFLFRSVLGNLVRHDHFFSFSKFSCLTTSKMKAHFFNLTPALILTLTALEPWKAQCVSRLFQLGITKSHQNKKMQKK